jgi:hypothetical protein
MKDQPILECQDNRRRQAVREKHRNGIDYVEVDETDPRNLRVQLFRTVPGNIDRANVVIEGGRRIRDIKVTNAVAGRSPESESDDLILVTVDKPGDFSAYTLRLVEVADVKATDIRLQDFDPRYLKVQFSFKVNCPSDLDCKIETACAAETRDEPEISYLAKDYASFRQLILDRLTLIMPDWQERHVPDIGIALVEVLAYIGDYLSYYQDAVSTEAYLDTARQRISVRRHARLVDYRLHEGCNARAWVTVSTNQDITDDRMKLNNLYFTTAAGAKAAEVFEPMRTGSDETLKLFVEHNEIRFYTWGDEECCLPRGATSATLVDRWVQEETGKNPASTVPTVGQTAQPHDAAHTLQTAAAIAKPKRSLQLKKNDILIFEEVIGPKTGNRADADPSRRWAVQLTRDGKPDVDSLNDQPVVEIEWAAADALPFSFCLSARRPAPDCDLLVDVSVAHGNVILVDHGRTIDPEDLGQVGETETVGDCACEGSVLEVTDAPAPFRPGPLKQSPLTFSEPVGQSRSALVMLNQDPRKALPNIVSLQGLPGICSASDGLELPKIQGGVVTDSAQWLWNPKLDLLSSQSQDQDFVVEVDNDGRAHLRFGDGDLGRRPEACMIFSARYRVGNGPAGNVGADTITTAAFHQTISGLTLQPRNPLPARGGTLPEPTSEAKLFAPGAFRNDLQRAVIADDYARLAERNAKVQRAAASLRWTGSWYAAQVAIDPSGSETAGRALLHEIKGYLHRYRRMGHDLEVRQAVYVPLEIEIQVCVLPHYLRGHVEAVLLDVFSSRRLRDGQIGFFHPDNLTFGEGIYLSKLVAAAQAVTGVESAQVTVLQRLGDSNQGEIDEGVLRLGPLEVAQLDNDPNYPEHGTLKLKTGGGR